MLTFAGQDLLLEDDAREVQCFRDWYLPLDETSLFSPPMASVNHRAHSRADCGAKTGLPLPNWPKPPRLKINSLWWPTGASRWARGLFLCTLETLGEILAVVGDANAPQELFISDEDRFNLTADMFLLPPRPISAVTGDDDNEGLWLLPLVDERYYWQTMHVGELEVENDTEWSDVIEHITGELGIDLETDAIASNYFRPDRVELTRRFENAAVVLDAVLLSVGLRFVRLLDGTNQAIGPESSADRVTENLTTLGIPYDSLAGGGFGDKAVGATRPETVRVVFPRYHLDKPQGDMNVYSIATLAEDAGETEVTGSVEHVVFSTAGADFVDLEDSDPDNLSQLTDLAEKITEDFYLWLAGRYDYCFASIKPWNPTGFDDAIEFAFGFQRPDGSYAAQTRVQTLPANFGVTEQLSQVLETVDCQDDQVIVGVPPASEGDGIVLPEPTEDGWFDGRIATYNAGADAFEVSATEVWVRSLNHHPLHYIAANMMGFAKSIGTKEIDGDERPAYVIETPPERIEWGELQEELTFRAFADVLLDPAGFGVVVSCKDMLLNTGQTLESGTRVAIGVRMDVGGATFRGVISAACEPEES